jgi:hypothetical protein
LPEGIAALDVALFLSNPRCLHNAVSLNRDLMIAVTSRLVGAALWGRSRRGT